MHNITRRALVFVIATFIFANLPAQETIVDLLIQNARVVDGTGSPWFRSDVAIRNGRIVDMGTNLKLDARDTIDAAGRVLAPGFIDVHTHVESSDRRDGLQRLPRADNYVLDGVTTIVTGNCGGSEIDIAAWNSSLSGLGINVATLIGHNSVRRAVMGLDDRAPTPRELEQMQMLVDQAMQDGAVGFSTGLLYVPGTYATTEEVISLAEVASRYGGVYASHIREQGAKLHDSIDEAVRVGREAGMPVQISHFKLKGRTRWGNIGKAIELVESYRRQGVDVVIDAYPYDRASSNLGITLPRWAVSGGAEEIAARIQDDDSRPWPSPIAEQKVQPPPIIEAPPSGRPQTININRADAEALQIIPGIGPVLARRIIEYRRTRPFKRTDDLIEISGIGPKTLEKMRPWVSVR